MISYFFKRRNSSGLSLLTVVLLLGGVFFTVSNALQTQELRNRALVYDPQQSTLPTTFCLGDDCEPYTTTSVATQAPTKIPGAISPTVFCLGNDCDPDTTPIVVTQSPTNIPGAISPTIFCLGSDPSCDPDTTIVVTPGPSDTPDPIPSLTPEFYCLGTTCPTVPPEEEPTVDPTIPPDLSPTFSESDPSPTPEEILPSEDPEPTDDPCSVGESSISNVQTTSRGGFLQGFFEFIFRLIGLLLGFPNQTPNPTLIPTPIPTVIPTSIPAATSYPTPTPCPQPTPEESEPTPEESEPTPIPTVEPSPTSIPTEAPTPTDDPCDVGASSIQNFGKNNKENGGVFGLISKLIGNIFGKIRPSPSPIPTLDPCIQPDTYIVTLKNLTSGQPFSPPIAATHNRKMQMFQVGKVASDELAAIAQGGNQTPMFDLFNNSSEVTHAVKIDRPITTYGKVVGSNTDTVSFEIQANPKDKFSLATMLICTNDGFLGLDSVNLPQKGKKIYSLDGYDAGRENNTEKSEDIVDGCSALGPKPLLNDPNGNIEDAVESSPFQSIKHHSAITDNGDLSSLLHNWKNPVAEVTIEKKL